MFPSISRMGLGHFPRHISPRTFPPGNNVVEIEAGLLKPIFRYLKAGLVKEIIAVHRKREIMPKLAPKLIYRTTRRRSHLIKHVFCSNGSWIDGNRAVPILKYDLMIVSSVYIDLFHPGESLGRNVRRKCPDTLMHISLMEGAKVFIQTGWEP